MKNGKYVVSVFALTNLKFVVTALQYWVPHYMKVILGASEHLTFLLVSITVISATSVGALTGGFLTTKCLGSYTNPKSIYLCLLLFLLLALAALPLSFLTEETLMFGGVSYTVYLFISLVWLIMFAHGFIEPIFTGILLNTSADTDSNVASSVIIFAEMVFGFLPAPYVYGLLMEALPDITGKEGLNQSRWGMRGVTAYSALGVIALGIATIWGRKRPQSEKEGGPHPEMYIEETTYVYETMVEEEESREKV